MLSVCIITKNEERHLTRCLSSIKGVASEVIIVDSGSSDKTLEIAEFHGCKVLSIKWVDDYSYARNHGISHCSFPWILCIDADETLEHSEKLISRIKSARSNVGGFVMSRNDEFINLETGKRTITPIGLVRLFRNHQGIRFQERVHEIVGPSILSSGFKLAATNDFFLKHHIVEHSKEFLIEKQLKYLKIINENLEDGVNHWLSYQKAKTLWFLGESNEAGKLFEMISELNDSELSVASLNNLATLSMIKEDYEKSVYWLNRSLELDHKQSQAHFIFGDLELRRGNTKTALRHFNKVRTKLHLTKSGFYIPGGLFLLPHQKLYRLALCFYQYGSLKRSLLILNKSLRKNAEYVDALYLRAKVLVKLKKKEIAVADLGRIESLNPEWTEPSKYRSTLGL